MRAANGRVLEARAWPAIASWVPPRFINTWPVARKKPSAASANSTAPRRMRACIPRLFDAAVDLALLEARKHLAGEHFDALDCLLVSEEARAADDVQMAEVAGLALEVDDLAIDG